MQPVMFSDETHHFKKSRRPENSVPRLAFPSLGVGVLQHLDRFTPQGIQLDQGGPAVFMEIVALARPHAGIRSWDKWRFLLCKQSQLHVMDLAFRIAQMTDQLCQRPIVGGWLARPIVKLFKQAIQDSRRGKQDPHYGFF